MFQSCMPTLTAQMRVWAWGNHVIQEIFLCLGQWAVWWTLRTADGRFRPPALQWEEAWGVGGLCKLAKGVYTEIQAWETNGHKRKTFIRKQHHMLDFEARGVSVHEKLSFLLHSKKNRWCHTRKSLWRNSILLSLLEPTAHHSGYFKEIPWSSLLVRLLSS